MSHYKTEQLAQDEKFDEKWTDVMQWSDDYGDREAKGSSASQIKSYHLLRDQALLEAFKKDVREWAEIKRKTPRNEPHEYVAEIHNVVLDDLLSLLKDYNPEKWNSPRMATT